MYFMIIIYLILVCITFKSNEGSYKPVQNCILAGAAIAHVYYYQVLKYVRVVFPV